MTVSIEKILIYRSQLKLLMEEADRAYPYETSAVLVGMIRGEEAAVTDVYVTGSVKASSTSFEVDPSILLDAYHRADEEGRDVIGIFHTHPAPPRPSGVDIEYMKMNPVVWLIMSMPSKHFKAYQYRDGVEEEVRVEIL